MFKSSYAELKPGIFGRVFPEKGKQPAGELAATVMVNTPISLVESLCRCHCRVPNPHCLKTEAAWALANKLLIFSDSHKPVPRARNTPKRVQLDGIPSPLKGQEGRPSFDSMAYLRGAAPRSAQRQEDLPFLLACTSGSDEVGRVTEFR